MRKRSNYRPKGVRLDNIGWVMAGFKKLTDLTDQNFIVRTRNHDALARIVKGEAQREDVEVVISALNMTEALAEVRKELGSDWRTEIHAALDALLAMARRGIERGRFLFTGPELVAVNLGMEIHDAQLDQATVLELERAMKIVDSTKASGRAIRIVEKTA